MTEAWVDYLTGPWGVPFAFAAGLLSFLSPCVLPIVPAYIAQLTGASVSGPGASPRREAVSHALAFVLGFTLVFTAIGASAGLVGGLLTDHLDALGKVAGVFLIVTGLNLMGVIRIPWLYRTFQLPVGSAGAGFGPGTASVAEFQARGLGGAALNYSRSAGLGAAFSVGWTPCIGPVLGAIFALAAESSTVGQGAYLLLAYGLGLGVPFIVTGFALGTVSAWLRKLGPALPAIEFAAGAIVVFVGALIFLGDFRSVNQYFDFGFLKRFQSI